MSDKAMGIAPLVQQNHFQKNSWVDDLTVRIDASEQKFDASFLQHKMDNLGSQIKREFAFIPEYNNWLEENNQEEFYEQFASYLLKLPLRSARNILTAFYSVISTALYVAVHPVKGIHHLAKETVKLLHELTDPQVWSKLGGSGMGLLVGQSMILGNPLSLIGMAIGGALVVGGVSVDALITAIKAEEGKELHNLKESFQTNVQSLPDTILLGFFTGLFLGGIRRAMDVQEKPIEIQKKPIEIHERSIEINPKPIDIREIDPIPTPQPGILDPYFEKIRDVAQWGHADWSGHIETVSNLTLNQAKEMAANNPNIDYFFYMKQGAVFGNKIFQAGDAVFFSGEPYWGSAVGMADGYIKF